jgi:hypothetical protein
MLPRSSGQVAREVVTQTHRRRWDSGALSWLIGTVGRNIALFGAKVLLFVAGGGMELREKTTLFRAAIFIFVHRRQHGIARTSRFACIIQPMPLPTPNLENWGRIFFRNVALYLHNPLLLEPKRPQSEYSRLLLKGSRGITKYLTITGTELCGLNCGPLYGVRKVTLVRLLNQALFTL